MAAIEGCELYRNATIDCADMTLTEYRENDVRIYDIKEILKRWDGIPDIEILIRSKKDLPSKEGGI